MAAERNTITLDAAGGDSLTASFTLATTVVRANTILTASLRGGSNTSGQHGVKVTLSSDGTTVTAERQAAGSEVVVEFCVYENAAITAYHFDETITATGGQSVAIGATVDLAYSFIVPTGLESSGGTRGNDDMVGLEIDSTTTVNLEAFNSAGDSLAFQVIELSATELASVQFFRIQQTANTVDQTVTAVDLANTLIFASAEFQGAGGGDAITSAGLPTLELTTTTNLQASCDTFNNLLYTQAYVVEFVNSGVTSARTTGITGATTTEVLGGAPTDGCAIINGIYGRFSTANNADDDTLEDMWAATLSGSTWTFTRGASATTAALSYSAFDWATLFSTGPTGTLSTTSDDGTLAASGTVSAAASVSLDALAAPGYALSSDGVAHHPHTGTYTGSPTDVELRVMQGAVEISTWASADSFGAGVFSYDAQVPGGVGFNLEARLVGEVATDTGDDFDVGISALWVGSSSAARPFDLSSLTVNQRTHVRAGASWTTTASGATMAGESAATLANYLGAQLGFPVIFYDYGVGGTDLLVEWITTGSGTAYNAAVAATAAGDGNVSVIFDVAGTNDARGGTSVTKTQVETFHVALRSDVADVPVVILSGQREGSGVHDTAWLALWTAHKETAADDVDTYVVDRVDLDLAGDNIHNTQAASNLYCERAGAVIDFVFGTGTYWKGPSIRSVIVNGSDDIEINLDLAGTDYAAISPSSAIAGFRPNDSGTPVAVTAAVTNGADQIVLTPATAIASEDLTVDFAGYDANVPGGLLFTGYPTVDSAVNMAVEPIFAPLAASAEGTLLTTSDGGTLSASGTVVVNATGTLSTTSDDGALAASGELTITGTLLTTSDGGTLAASGTVVVNATGALSTTSDDGTLVASGELTITGALAATSDDGTMVASGFSGSGVIGTLSTTSDDGALAASGELTVTGTLSTTSDAGTLAASGELTVTGTLATTSDDGTLAASGELTITGALATTSDDGTMVAFEARLVAGAVLTENLYAGALFADNVTDEPLPANINVMLEREQS